MASKDPWAHRLLLEARYLRQLEKMMREVTVTLADDLNPGEILQHLRGIADDPTWIRWSEQLSSQMVTEVARDSGRTWRQAANGRRPSRAIYEALQSELSGSLQGTYSALIGQNAEYIRSVPADIARIFTEHIAKRAVEGLRSSEITRELREMYPHVSRVKARLIARTETSKTHTAIEHARSERLGIRWYQWETADDARVRPSHRKMDRVLVPWDDPPAPEALAGEKTEGHYHAGNVWNCRCVPLGVLLLDDVDWPAKVYYRGSIRRMTRGQFERDFWTPTEAAVARRTG